MKYPYRLNMEMMMGVSYVSWEPGVERNIMERNFCGHAPALHSETLHQQVGRIILRDSTIIEIRGGNRRKCWLTIEDSHTIL